MGYIYLTAPASGHEAKLDPESREARNPNSYVHQDLGLAIKRRLVLHRIKSCIRNSEIE
jgi:hypothetical protein